VPRIEILTIGDELVEGRLVDTNAGELSARLADLGLPVARHQSVGDDLEEMVDALRSSAGRSDAVLVSGGLGPTGDDLTAEAAAAAFGLKIERFDEALDHTRRFFTDRGREMPPTNEKQADLPAGCTILPNPEGTAVGFRLDTGTCRLYFMPGVPRELRRMADESVIPDLAARLEATTALVATLKLFGVGESDVAHRLAGIEDVVPETTALTVQYRATFPEIHVRLVIEGAEPKDGEAVLEALVAESKRRLGRHVFATGGSRLDIDFPTRTANLLDGSGMTIAAAEVASGGLLAHLVGASDAGRRCLNGGVVAINASVLGAQLGIDTVNAETAADAVRTRFGAAVGVATLGSDASIDGHPPGSLAVAAVGPETSKIRELVFPLDRSRFQRLAAYAALALAIRVVNAKD
jgi:nicotinamide-nucleotide amidase